MRLNAVILLLVVSVSLCRCSNNNEAAKLFGNMTYFIGNKNDSEAVSLSNGKYYKQFYWDVYYDHRYVYGDFNHDGLKDAAVIIVVNYGGGNMNSYVLAFLINDGKKLVHRSSRELDVWAMINSLREENGKVLVDMYIHQTGDCNAGPTKRVRNIYEYSGQDFFEG